MRTDYKIFTETNYDFGRCGTYDICYRLIICHALHSLVRATNDHFAQESFAEFYNCFQSNNQYPLDIPVDVNFLFFFAIEMTHEGKDTTGYVLVDKSKGCYPLVFYPFQANEEASARTSALDQAIDDINENIQLIIRTLTETEEWSRDLQTRLHTIFKEKNTG